MNKKEKPPTREQITIRPQKELFDALKAEADERGMPIKDLIMIIIHQHLNS